MRELLQWPVAFQLSQAHYSMSYTPGSRMIMDSTFVLIVTSLVFCQAQSPEPAQNSLQDLTRSTSEINGPQFYIPLAEATVYQASYPYGYPAGNGYGYDNGVDVEIIGDPSEMLQPAENVVFRPLFSYRKLQEKRRRQQGIKGSSTPSPNSLRRNAEASTSRPIPRPYPYSYYNGGYVYPYYYY